MASARHSYLDLMADLLSLETVPAYGSYQAKFAYDVNASNRMWALALGGYDTFEEVVDEADLEDVSLQDVSSDRWQVMNGVGWQHLLDRYGYGRLTLSLATNTFTTDVLDRQLDGQLTYRNRTRNTRNTVAYDLMLRSGNGWNLEAGGSFRDQVSDLELAQPFGTENPFSLDPERVNAVDVDSHLSGDISSGYVDVSRRVVPRLEMTAGTRVDHYHLLGDTRLGPRLGLRLQLTPTLAVTASAGRYFQQPDLAFIGADPANRELTPIEADHYIAGISWLPRSGMKLSVEAFRKIYRDYPVSLEYPTVSLANFGAQYEIDGLLFPMTSKGSGRAQGLELFLQKRLTGALYGQIAYTVSQTRHAALDGVMRPGTFDSPQTFSAIGGYRLGRAWQVSTRFTYASGLPYTPPLVDASAEQNRWIHDLTRVSAERLPAYHRLDVRVDRTFSWRGTNVAIFGEIQNIYNRNNVAAYEWNPKTRTVATEKQLPLIPIIGINWEF